MKTNSVVRCADRPMTQKAELKLASYDFC